MTDVKFQAHIQELAPSDEEVVIQMIELEETMMQIWGIEGLSKNINERAKTVRVKPVDVVVAERFREKYDYNSAPTVIQGFRDDRPIEAVARTVAAIRDIKARGI